MILQYNIQYIQYRFWTPFPVGGHFLPHGFVRVCGWLIVCNTGDPYHLRQRKATGTDGWVGELQRKLEKQQVVREDDSTEERSHQRCKGLAYPSSAGG